jgi:hypothetical protein
MFAEQAVHRLIVICQLGLIEESSRRTAGNGSRAGLGRCGESNVNIERARREPANYEGESDRGSKPAGS